MSTLTTPFAKRQALRAILLAYPGGTNMAQCRRVRAALSEGNLTTFEAMRYLDVYDPRARVMQLRRSGDQIDTHWQVIHTESGDRHRVGLYVLRPSTDPQP